MNIIFTTLLGLFTSQRCTSPMQRREIRDLSEQELNTFLRTFRALGRKNQRTGISVIDQYTRIHNDNVRYAHGVPGFLPWHRQYIRNIEKELQKINPRVVLPFWDWTKDSQAPDESPIFAELGFGGNGNRGRDMCVTDGAFSNLQVMYPRPHCLRRDFDDGNRLSPFASPEIMLRLLYNGGDYESFYKELEIHHGAVHVNIGGDRGDMFPMTSPNDPLFFLHHVFIDMIWWNRQRINNFQEEYNGRDQNTRTNARLTDQMRPFQQRVRDVLDVRTRDLCYTYPIYDPINDNDSNNLQRRQLVPNLLGGVLHNKKIDIDSLLSSRNNNSKMRVKGAPAPSPQNNGVPQNLQLLAQAIHTDVSSNSSANSGGYNNGSGDGLRPVKHLPDNYLRMIKADRQYSRSVHNNVNALYSYLNSRGYKALA